MANDTPTKTIISVKGTPFSRKLWGAILILFLLLWVSLCVIGAVFDRFYQERKQTRGRPLMYTSRSYSHGFGSSPTSSSRSESSDAEEEFEKAVIDYGGKKKGKKVRFKLRESPRNKQQPAQTFRLDAINKVAPGQFS
ncbi:hypothetical protein TWF506_001900 [Arthrobotrys conoides]|uniref:Uncharacterized protein n=1 Tax=Arthrobotrys conoides TaxID=74498 RepID=A0AAN8NI03_9PEZI